MKFSELTQFFNEIETLSSRNAITEKLAELFQQADAEEVKIITYISLGSLRPPYEGTQFNIAERSIKKVLEEVLEISTEQMNKLVKDLGDLGAVTATGIWKAQKQLTVKQVYDALLNIEDISGIGAQEKRLDELKELLKALSPADASLVVRIVLGKLRLGFSDMTIIDGLSWTLAGNKSLHEKIEHAYNLCADLGHIAYLLKTEGVAGLEQVHITLGIPIRPAAAERLPTAQDVIEKLGPCAAQLKLDGFRLQVHIDNRPHHKRMWFFSRNLINMSDMFPDLHAALESLPVENCIFEGEAIVFDEEAGMFTPFQETVKRKRKHGIEEAAEELPLKLFVFDIVYLNNESLLTKTHHTRREILEKLMRGQGAGIVQPIEERYVTTAKELESYFLQVINEGLEGLVVKKPNSPYQPGKRNFNWIKLKRHERGGLEDTIDGVILGYYYGQGRRTAFGIGAFLIGVYNKQQDRFETLAKIGTGLSDAEWVALKQRCDKLKVKEQPHNIVCAKELAPHVWIYPELVVTVKADEITQSPLHSAGKDQQEFGYALRFPRMAEYREDKSAQEATTVQEIKQMFQNQKTR
jgi:DNA ligase-1